MGWNPRSHTSIQDPTRSLMALRKPARNEAANSKSDFCNHRCEDHHEQRLMQVGPVRHIWPKQLLDRDCQKHVDGKPDHQFPPEGFVLGRPTNADDEPKKT
jgi:hypothetical protein